MEWLKALLESQPLFALFLTIALGYLLGEVNIKGLSLGSGAVLFVALAIGAIAPKSAPPALLGTLGLLLFLYGVGLGYGKEFFRGLSSSQGLKANFAALCGLAGALAVTMIAVELAGVKLGYALGTFAGAGTSTATLQAVITALKSDDPAVGYSVAYPIGVAVPILILYLGNAILKPKIPPPAGSRLEFVEVAVRSDKVIGKPFASVKAKFPVNMDVGLIRREHRNIVPTETMSLQADDVLLLISTDKAALARVAQEIGEVQAGRVTNDRTDLDYIRVFASKRTVVGVPLSTLKLPMESECRLLHVRRGDADLLPHDDLILEFGDRVGLLTPREHIPELRRYFGDSIKGTAEFSYISIGIGAAIGLAIGMIPIPIPGVGKLSLGLAGLLLFALWLGKVRRTAGVTWTMPLSANLVLRNFGLTVFLAQVGMSSGQKFVNTVAATGWTFLVLSVLIVTVLVLLTMIVCMVFFKMPYDEVGGIVSGVTGNPAILAFAARITPTDKPDIGYAMIFPSMTVVKIIIVQVAAVLVGAG